MKFSLFGRNLILIIVAVFLLVLGIYILYPVGVTQDTAIHTEIAGIVKSQGYPNTWQPYAENEFTYPPFFHYLAIFLNLFGLPLVEAVRILGIMIFITFPVTVYYLVKTYREDSALYAAVISAVVPALSNVFMMAEFPQLLSMELIILLIYFLRTRKYLHASVVTGLVIITHPLMSIIAVLIHLYHFPFKENPRIKILSILIPLLIASFWIPKYINVAGNALSGQWENVEYNSPPYNQPVFWFWPAETIADFLFGLDFFTPILLPLAFFGFYKTKNRFLRILFLLSLIFTIFHIPYTQLKILDLLSIPIIILAAIGIKEISLKLEKKHYKSVFVLIVFVFLFSFQIYHYVHAKTLWGNQNVPSDSLIGASMWLKEYDSGMKRIYVTRASAWVGVISGKLPLNPDVSYLERFSDEYAQQLSDWEQIGRGIKEKTDVSWLLRKWNVNYVITENNITVDYLKEIYSGTWNVYEVL